MFFPFNHTACCPGAVVAFAVRSIRISRGSAPLLSPELMPRFSSSSMMRAARPVAEAQATLQQRDARFLFAADDFNALLDDLFVLVNRAAHRRQNWPA